MTHVDAPPALRTLGAGSLRFLLVNPPLSLLRRGGFDNPVASYLFYNSVPLGLLYLAAVLRAEGHQVGLLDAAAEGLDTRVALERILAWNPHVVGFTSTTVGFSDALALVRALKGARPRVPTLLGGVHATLSTEDALRDPALDLGVLGEGEQTVVELARFFQGRGDLADIRGLAWRQGDGTLHRTAPRPKLMDLDSLPFPAQDLPPPGQYQPLPVDENGLPKYTLLTSRGCPHQCVFCQGAGSAYRSHGTGRIVDELQQLVQVYGARDVAFIDSLFCFSAARVSAICEEILRRDLRVSWTCSTRVDVLEPDLLRLMARAGCWRIRMGIESGSDRVLRFITKRVTTDRVRQVVGWAAQAGIRTKGFFILGHLVDDAASIEETIRFGCSLPLHDITVQLNTILPATRQWELFHQQPDRYGRLVSEGSAEAHFWEPTFVPWGLEPDELADFQRRFYRRFYLRPGTAWRHLRSIHTGRDVVKYLRALGLFVHLAA